MEPTPNRPLSEVPDLKMSPWCVVARGARVFCIDCGDLLAEHPDPAICATFGYQHVRETGHRVEVERRQVRVLSKEACVTETERFTTTAADATEQLLALTDACWHVPVKSDRAAEEQAAVETFTSAVVDARAWLRKRGFLR